MTPGAITPLHRTPLSRKWVLINAASSAWIVPCRSDAGAISSGAPSRNCQWPGCWSAQSRKSGIAINRGGSFFTAFMTQRLAQRPRPARRIPPPRRHTPPAAAPAPSRPAARPHGSAPPPAQCVTQISGAPTSSTVAFSSSQSLWSEITSGNSTPRLFARWRTRIQPDARHDHRVFQPARPTVGNGTGWGQHDLAPTSAAFAATVAGRRVTKLDAALDG